MGSRRGAGKVGVDGAIDDLQDQLASAVAAHATEGIVVCDPRMTYMWVNEAAGRILGRRPDDLLGRNLLTSSFPSRTHPVMTRIFAAQLAGLTGTYPATLLRSDGSEVDVCWSTVAFDVVGARYGAAVFRRTFPTASHPRAVTSSEPAMVGAHPVELITRLQELAEIGTARTRALMVALDLVDDDFVMRSGGRSHVPAGFSEAQQAVSAAGGRIPYFEVWVAGRAVVIGDARTKHREDPAFRPLADCLDAAFDWNGAVYTAIAFGGHAWWVECLLPR